MNKKTIEIILDIIGIIIIIIAIAVQSPVLGIIGFICFIIAIFLRKTNEDKQKKKEEARKQNENVVVPSQISTVKQESNIPVTKVPDDILVEYSNEILTQTQFAPKAKTVSNDKPAQMVENRITLDSKKFKEYINNSGKTLYENTGVVEIDISKGAPIIELIDDGVKTNTYVLELSENKPINGKYFHYSIRMFCKDKTSPILSQFDGFFSESNDENEKMKLSNVAYRFEGYVLKSDGPEGEKIKKETDGADLYDKGLRYPGFITPGNVNLVGVCSKCGKSITFLGYNFPHMQADACYSDDGIDVYQLNEPISDKENWSKNVNGKTFRYYNSFRCIHCGAPYIDYENKKESKTYGVLGCCYLNHQVFRDN